MGKFLLLVSGKNSEEIALKRLTQSICFRAPNVEGEVLECGALSGLWSVALLMHRASPCADDVAPAGLS
jgi:hypothetical protein